MGLGGCGRDFEEKIGDCGRMAGFMGWKGGWVFGAGSVSQVSSLTKRLVSSHGSPCSPSVRITQRPSLGNPGAAPAGAPSQPAAIIATAARNAPLAGR